MPQVPTRSASIHDECKAVYQAVAAAQCRAALVDMDGIAECRADPCRARRRQRDKNQQSAKGSLVLGRARAATIALAAGCERAYALMGLADRKPSRGTPCCSDKLLR